MKEKRYFPMHGMAYECVVPDCTSAGHPATGRCYHHIVITHSFEVDPPSAAIFMPGAEVPEGERFSYRTEDGATVEAYVTPLGIASRSDGPAITKWSEEGWLEDEHFHIDGFHHRLDGPAVIGYDDKVVVYVDYFRNGKESRIDGPAYVEWDDASIRTIVTLWRFRGEQFDSLEEIGKRLLELNEAELRHEVRHSSYAALLDEDVDPHRVAEAIAAGVSTTPGIRAFLDGAPGEWARSWEGEPDSEYVELRNSIEPTHPDGHRLREA